MKPTRQTIFVADHPKGRGNCMSACLASLLELPIDDVIDTCSDEVRELIGFHEAIRLWLGDRGLKLQTVMHTPEAKRERLKGVYSIGCGPSPRGKFSHAVICKSGRIVFDPHPSDDGLTRIKYHEVLAPLSEAEQKLHNLCGGYRRALATRHDLIAA